MDSAAGTNEKVGFNSWCPFLISDSIQKLKDFAQKIRKIGKDDPRRVFHSLKVGLALTLVSIFYYVNPLFQGFGTSTMWAVLTVVVVMEYTVGGTLSKGLNRAFATLLAGALGLGAHHLAAVAGDKGEPILLGVFVFMLAAMATFSRFVPEMKARHDYGVTIFILTFSLVAVSSYREEELIKLAYRRLSTVAIGVTTCLCTSMFVFPVWAGEDLHMLVAANLDKLACFLEGMGVQYFGEKMESGSLEGKSFLQSYKTVLNSKATEDSLANFARWEPGHDRFGFRHPWNQYLKIGAVTRHCACSIEALNAYISTLQQSHQTTTDLEFKQMVQAACVEMIKETSKALAELSSSIREMKWSSTVGKHHAMATEAANRVKALVPAENSTLLDVLISATTASLVTEVVRCTNPVIAAVEELSRLVEFKRPEHSRKAGAESPPHVVIVIEK
ncbi:hypothetical protein KFK09_022338 [Dendrobium nobile]|uniref:Aluminum-activated malate transporter 1 n=1 Tax=Dendrobium nobile TaxID=94219 RepID=A0A8T3AJ44_DENNO|nr:hypothetical protein KFK09_022338 [Dendrobium nobile]